MPGIVYYSREGNQKYTLLYKQAWQFLNQKSSALFMKLPQNTPSFMAGMNAVQE